MRKLATLMLLALLLCGCGYKGPLYLPPPDQAKAAPLDSQKSAPQAPKPQ